MKNAAIIIKVQLIPCLNILPSKEDDSDPPLVGELDSLYIKVPPWFLTVVVNAREEPANVAKPMRHNIQWETGTRVPDQDEDTVILVMMKEWFPEGYNLARVLRDDSPVLYEISGNDMEPLNPVLPDLIGPDDDPIGGVGLKLLKGPLILPMQLRHRGRLPVPPVQFHRLEVVVDLLLGEVQLLCLEGVVDACLVLRY